MAKLTHTEIDWTQPNREFAIIRANVDSLMMDVLDNKLGSKHSIKCDTITEWIAMAQWNDVKWMLWLSDNKEITR